MKRFLKVITLALSMLVMIFSLSSCSSSNQFASDFGLDSDECNFEYVSIDDVESFISNKKTFALTVGKIELAKTTVKNMQASFTSSNYEGVAMYLSTEDALKSLSAGEKMADTLGVTGIDSNIFFLTYYNGTLDINTLEPDSDACAKFNLDDSISFYAIADFISQYYPLESVSKLR